MARKYKAIFQVQDLESGEFLTGDLAPHEFDTLHEGKMQSICELEGSENTSYINELRIQAMGINIQKFIKHCILFNEAVKAVPK